MKSTHLSVRTPLTLLLLAALCLHQAHANNLAGTLLPGTSKQKPSPRAANTAPIKNDELRARLLNERAKLERLTSAGSEDAGVPAGTPPNEVAARRYFQQLLVGALTTQIDANDRLDAARGAGALGETEPTLKGPAPYAIAEVDRLRQRMQAAAMQVDWLEIVQRLCERDLNNAGIAHRRGKESERKALELLERKRGESAPGRALWKYQLAELESQATGVELQAQESTRSAVEEELKQARSRYRELEAALVATDGNVRFSKEDLQLLLSRNETRQAGLEKELLEKRRAAESQRLAVSQSKAAVDKAEQEQLVAQEELVKPTVRRGRPLSPEALERNALRARDESENSRRELKLAQLRLQATLSEIDTLRRLVNARQLQRTFWELRFAEAENAKTAERDRETEDRVRRLLDHLKEPESALRQSLQLNLDQTAILQDRILEASPGEGAVLRRELEILSDRRLIDIESPRLP